MSELLFLQQALGIPELHLQSAEVKENHVWITAGLMIEKGVCPDCETICTQAHQYLERSVRHLPMWGKTCGITYLEPQMECPQCGRTFVPPAGFLLPRHPHVTREYAQYLFDRMKGNCIKVLAQQEGLPEKTLEAIYYAVAEERDRSTPLEPTTHVGIDEISTQKGHGKFKAVISDLKRGQVLDLLESREKAVLVAWFRGKPPEWRAAVRVVSIDLWEPYRQGVKEVFGQRVMLVADKFHGVKQFNGRIQDTRREIQREAPPEVQEALKGIRWAILKDPKHLKGEERRALGRALASHPPLRRMYELKKAFLKIYRVGVDRPIRRLKGWIKRARAAGLRNLEKFVRTLENWWDEITAYFRSGATNAGCEGLNTVIKLVNRRAYGYRNHRHFVLRVKHETGALSA